MPSASNLIRTLFALCLLGATFNHVRAIQQHGWLWDYGYGNQVALASKMYWDALTMLDPLAAALLFALRRAGIWLTMAIIVSDVLHNTWYVAAHAQWFASFYLAQLLFLTIVIGLAPLALRSGRPGLPTAAADNEMR